MEKATSYVEKYMAKEEVFPEGIETGRIWGVWNKKLLPIKWETVRISSIDAYKIRRWFRRLAKMRGRGYLRSLTVFVRHENVVRLLEFLVPPGGVARVGGARPFSHPSSSSRPERKVPSKLVPS